MNEQNEIKVSCAITKREHTFLDQEKGEVVDTILIAVQMPKSINMQPHESFEESVSDMIREMVENEIQLYLEM